MNPSFSKTFTDKAGREWPLHIGLVALERMRVAGVPLESIVPMPGAKSAESALAELSDLLHGSMTAVNAVMAILGAAIEKLGLSREEFLESIDDEAIMLAMGQALYQAIMDFFQKSPLRQAMVSQAWKRGAAMMQKSAAMIERFGERMAMQPEPTDSEMDAMVLKASQQAGRKFAGGTPGQSDLNHQPK